MANNANGPQWRNWNWSDFGRLLLSVLYPLSPSDSGHVPACFVNFIQVWPFFSASPISLLIKKFKICDVSLWPLLCFLSLIPHSQCSLTTISLSREPTASLSPTLTSFSSSSLIPPSLRSHSALSWVMHCRASVFMCVCVYVWFTVHFLSSIWNIFFLDMFIFSLSFFAAIQAELLPRKTQVSFPLWRCSLTVGILPHPKTQTQNRKNLFSFSGRWNSIELTNTR